MAAFIVISTNDRLHFLVDGIEKCRPLNPGVHTDVSIGKILKKDNGYVYEYRVYGEYIKSEEGESNKLSDLLSNQIASFRQAFSLADNIVRIFLLENPMNEEEYAVTQSWVNAFYEVYNKGKGRATNFYLHRLLFTYDVGKPNDVVCQIDAAIIKKYIDGQRAGEALDGNSNIFYIDNQDRCDAVTCSGEKDHRLFMLRMLADFMMLISNKDDSYGVANAIIPNTGNTNCFSVGYGESMYCYDDVERYYHIADIRDLLDRCLNDEDTTTELPDEDAMDVETYPLGLLKRRQRLSTVYSDVPYSKDINHYPSSEDKKIDDCLSELKVVLCRKRQQEQDKINEKVKIEEANLEDCTLQIQNKEMEVQACEDASMRHKLEMELEELVCKKEEAEQSLTNLKGLTPECPEFISREDVYCEFLKQERDSTDNKFDNLKGRYKYLLNYVSGDKLYDYLKEESETAVSQDVSTFDGSELAERKGCLSFLLFWRKDKSADVSPGKTDAEKEESGETLIKVIRDIRLQLYLKNKFTSFSNRIVSIKTERNIKNGECHDFKLTTHSHNGPHLIVLEKLKEEQHSTSLNRINQCIANWSNESDGELRMFGNLRLIVSDNSKAYTKRHFQYIDWEKPFSFLLDLNEKLPDVCNSLRRKSTPFVNYNVTNETAPNDTTYTLYSDKQGFICEVKAVENKLEGGNKISAYESGHIASKICMFQFLPLNDDILNNLVDVQVSDNV